MTTMTFSPAPPAPPARRTATRRPTGPRVIPAAVRGCAGADARGAASPPLAHPAERRAVPVPAGLAPRTTTPARLTRRGRVALVLGFVGVLGGGLAAGQATVGAPSAPTSYEVLTVQPGQTLWGIANDVAPGIDPRTTVERLVAVNGLVDADDITAGDRLSVPLGR